MVIGWVHRERKAGNRSAWELVEAAQREVQMPCLLIPQPAHAVLAGELASALLPSAFGELPPEIVRAIQMHDTGWAASDAQQIQRLRAEGAQASKAAPVSFVAISPAEAMEAWTASVDAVESLSKAGALVVSRHFTLLAQHDAARHQRFLQTEKPRQQRLASSAPSAGDLDRWTAALGFCDLLSLYLLCGMEGEIELTLAHPASSRANQAPRTTLQIAQQTLRFSPLTLASKSTLSIQALRHPLPAQGPRAETLHWVVKP